MALLVNSGRAGLAAALKARPMFFAWGRGASWWGQTDVKNKTFASSPERFTLDHAPVASLTLNNLSNAQTYATPADYIFDPNTGIVTRVNGGAIPSGATVQAQAVYGTTSLGSGDTVLVSEIGRRIASTVEFVVPDPNGNLYTPGGERWSVSTGATRYLYVATQFDFLEASTETIREVGIFVDSVRAAGVPEGQLYLTPEEVAEPGYLLLLDRFAGIPRSPSSRQGFSYVLVI
ncbi:MULTISPECIES: hypothetical protein [unclassified Bradyrhizobium]|uniref:hypothetical protein n=1 Tax=unclassified Bradyrhizobium TaxID=2631580 RepID=UPI002915E593|nr:MULTISPECIES: hypothetical protein [unclassified Bradyrhizobium]